MTNNDEGLLKQHTTFANIHDPMIMLGKVIVSRSSFNLNDMAVSAEAFYSQILNIVYDLKLHTVRTSEEVIDLLTEDGTTAFQVTVRSEKKKIQGTLNGYSRSDNDKVKKVTVLRFLLISERQPNGYPGLKSPISSFNEENDVVDVKGLLETIKGLTDEKQERIAEYVLSKLPWWKRLKEMVSVHTDLQALEEYRSKFDHSAFHDPWQYEGSFIRFEKALDQFIALLKCGQFEGKVVTKRMDDFKDKSIKKLLDEVFKRVRKLRQAYTAISGGTAIDPGEQHKYQTPAIRKRLDDGKEAVIDALNQALKAAGVDPLPGVDPI